MLIHKIYLIFYYSIVKYLPSNGIVSKSILRIRAWLCGLIFEYSGTDINIGRNVYIGNGKRIRIGHRSGIGDNSCVSNNIQIGNDVMIAPELLVIARNHSFQSLTKPMNKQGVQPEGTVKVGDDVWIGQRVIILPNIKVGNGVIIGAGSVVTKNIPDFAIVAGNPAKIIRYRNNEAHEKRYS